MSDDPFANLFGLGDTPEDNSPTHPDCDESFEGTIGLIIASFEDREGLDMDDEEYEDHMMGLIDALYRCYPGLVYKTKRYPSLEELLEIYSELRKFIKLR